MPMPSWLASGAWLLMAVCAMGGCRQVAAERSNRTVILNRGSDTMINVAQGWAEAYAEVAANVSVEVAGGGSGVGIAALIDGTVQIANSSRPMKREEIAAARAHHGADPRAHCRADTRADRHNGTRHAGALTESRR